MDYRLLKRVREMRDRLRYDMLFSLASPTVGIAVAHEAFLSNAGTIQGPLLLFLFYLFVCVCVCPMEMGAQGGHNRTLDPFIHLL